jgi:hypothetical protein
LRQAYDAVYNEIEKYASVFQSSSKAVTERALSWIMYGQRSLTTGELLAAVSIKTDTMVSKEELLDLCCNLVVVDSGLDAFRFAHFSAREYLETRQEYTPGVTHARLAERCLLACLGYSAPWDLTPVELDGNQRLQDYTVYY